jgi:hypothetical protein
MAVGQMALLRAGSPFQTVLWVFPNPVVCNGVRLRGTPGGAARFVTCAELELTEAARGPAGWDVFPDRRAGLDDLYEALRLGADVIGDGVSDATDGSALRAAVRAPERRALLGR